MWLTDLLARMPADSIPRAFEIAMDGRGLVFAVGVSVLCGVIFGLAPAWHASGLEIGAALKQEARGGSPSGRRRILSIFVVSEIALALVLLVGASLLLTTFRNLRHVDAGFDSTNVLTAPAYLPEWKYETAGQQRLFVQRATAALAEIPGVTAVAAVNVLPLSGNNSSGAITLEGFPLPPPNQRESADRRAITPGYFAAMGIRLSAGRAFTEADNERAPGVVIVSRALAEHYWPGSDPLGKRLKLSRYTSTAPWLTIVGIAGDVRHGTLAAASRQVVYYPHAQIPSAGMELVVRIAGPAGTIPSAMRDAIRRLDPELPVDAINPMAAIVRASLFDQMLELGVLGTFALLAVVLAAAGVYGVMAYTIAEREQEFGIRLALGASPADIVRLVGFDGARLTLAGTAFGLAAAWAGTRLLSDLLYGVRPNDLAILGSTASVLALIAMAACIVPTVRALRANLLTTLRAR
jgi:putative ABC transport system permease protein